MFDNVPQLGENFIESLCKFFLYEFKEFQSEKQPTTPNMCVFFLLMIMVGVSIVDDDSFKFGFEVVALIDWPSKKIEMILNQT